jgi:hypothetical protein
MEALRLDFSIEQHVEFETIFGAFEVAAVV